MNAINKEPEHQEIEALPSVVRGRDAEVAATPIAWSKR